MVESRLGRRWSLAGSTFMTAFFCVVFVHVSEPLVVRVSMVVIGLSSTVSPLCVLSRTRKLIQNFLDDVGRVVWVSCFVTLLVCFSFKGWMIRWTPDIFGTKGVF
jgi:hypothetical protein